MTSEPPSGRSGARLLQVGVLVVMVVAFVGLITGTRQVPPQRGYAPAERVEEQVRTRDAPGAVSYLGWRSARLGPNAGMYAGAFEALEPDVDLLAPVEQSAGDRERALAARGAHRAYDGAPPTIPHPIEAAATNQCVACHTRGAVVFGKTAPVMSHREYPVCTQCHVPETSEVPAGPPIADNAFAGLTGYGRGETAWPGAPPTIPHPTNLRTACESCHGPLGAVGMRTPHPDRQSCTQCHAPSAELDGRMPLAAAQGADAARNEGTKR